MMLCVNTTKYKTKVANTCAFATFFVLKKTDKAWLNQSFVLLKANFIFVTSVGAINHTFFGNSFYILR